jgi:hypothetical protein
MKIIQNKNMAFRCPSDLRERLEAYADGNHLHLSSVIRSACSDWLKRKELERLDAEDDSRFSALVKEMMKYDGGRVFREDLK